MLLQICTLSVTFLSLGFMMAPHDNAAPAQDKKTPEPATILFLGNSLSAGYGLGPEFAFPALIQQKIDSLDWNFKVINAGLSGETSSGGLRRDRKSVV